MKDETKLESSSSIAVNQSLNKFTQGLKEASKFQRKTALESMRKQVLDSFSAEAGKLIFPPESISFIFKSTLPTLNDPVEKCRELAVEILLLILQKSDKTVWNGECTSSLILALAQRLGGKEAKETSEEIRLQLYNLVEKLIELKSKEEKTLFEAHFQEFITILINAFNDNYPEVKKRGCSCAKLLANRLTGSNFHTQSESLIKPLLNNLTHQHSRVRKEIVECLCEVVMHGNNKSVTDCVPHLAQRLFDQAPAVRAAVVQLVGSWLLNLPDRYSFFHRLIPLLLTGFVDEAVEIKELTNDLWWDVGVKYAKENDEELKDKASFLDNVQDSNYPPDLREKRPNLGCRELVRQNASKIIPGILNDVGDWVEATRVKSVQLLFVIIWQAEANITMSLETVLQTLFKASQEKLDAIQFEVGECARLLGHFTDPNLSLNFAIKNIKKMSSPNTGAVNILKNLLFGHGSRIAFGLLLDSLRLLNEISLTLDSQVQEKILKCCETILPIEKYSEKPSEQQRSEFNYLMFKTMFTVAALVASQSALKAIAEKLIGIVEGGERSKCSSYVCGMINEMKQSCEAWNDNSLEPAIFAKLVKDYGLSEEVIEQIMSVFRVSLNPSKDVELRT